MKKIVYILAVILLTGLSQGTVAAADYNANIYINNDLNPAAEIEYMIMDRVTVNGAYVVKGDVLDKPFIFNTGVKYYFFDIALQDYTNKGGPFAELSLTTTLLDTGDYSDLNIGGGYLQPLSEKIAFTIGGGYTYSRVEDHDFYIKAGLNFSLSDFFSEGPEDDRKAYLEKKYDWDEEMIEAVLNNEILKEMNEEQVRESLGEPERVVEGGENDYWIYESYDSEEGVLRQLIVFLEEEELTDWEVNEVEF